MAKPIINHNFFLLYCFYLRISLQGGLIIALVLEVVEVDLGI